MKKENLPPIDIRPDHWAIVRDILKRHVPDCDVWAFGSRASWTAKPYSDLDLAVSCAAPLSLEKLGALRDAFSESDLPWKVDVVDLATVDAAFRKIIEAGKVELICRIKWKKARLNELGEINRGRSRHRPRDAAHLYGGPYPFVQTGDIKRSKGRIYSHEQSYSEAGLAQSRLWPAGTMTITIAANIAETALLTYPACFPDSVVGFIAQEDKADVRFIEYLFRLLRRNIQQENVGTGSVQDNINLEFLRRLEFLIPEVTEQRAIASILSTLDDKIELNRRMNETLEQMAQAMFKDWFVDFGPVRRKQEGARDPIAIMGGLVQNAARAAELAGLFPDAFGDDGLPVGWKPLTLESIASLNDESWKTSNHPEIVEYVDLSNAKWGVIEATEIFSWKDAPSRARRVTKPLDTIVGTVRPGNGSYAFISQEGYTVSTGFAVLRPLNSSYADVLYIAATMQENIRRLANLADGHGGAYPAVNPSVVLDTEFPFPGERILVNFGTIAHPLREKIEQAKRENATLAETRDYLLPKLMSGEVRVRDAESIAEAAL